MKKNFDLISLGEAMVEMREEKEGVYQSAIAGDVLNATIGLSRLGARCGYIQNIGDDIFAEKFISLVRKEKIDMRLIKKVKGYNGLYFIKIDQKGERSFQYYRMGSAAGTTLENRNLDEVIEYIKKSKIFYFSGIIFNIIKDQKKIMEILKNIKGHTQIAFDPNIRQGLFRLQSSNKGQKIIFQEITLHDFQKKIKSVIPLVDMIFPTLDDEKIFNPRIKTKEIVEKYSQRNAIVAIKRGSAGCSLWMDGELKNIPARDVIPVDATGAGDAFNAGFLYGYLKGWSPYQSGQAGNILAGLKIRGRGAINKYLNKDLFLAEIKKLLNF